MKLWLRVALVVALVSIASLLLTGVVAIRVAGDAATATAVKAQERDASAVAASVERWVVDHQATLMGWALAFPLADYDQPRRNGLVRVVLSALPSAVIITLVDGDGQPVVQPAYFSVATAPHESTPGSPERAHRLVESLPITEALASPGGMAVGQPFLNEGKPSIPVAVVASIDPPLVLGAELTLDVLQELEAQSSPDRVVALLDRHGDVLTGTSDLLNADLLKSLLGTLASLTYEHHGNVVQGAVSPVGSTGWSAVVLEPADVALEGPRRIRRLLPVVIGAAMLLAIVLGLVLGRTVTEPIARLRDSVLAVAEGRLGVRADISRTDEVGELARAFNHMSQRLRDNQEQIKLQREAIESFNQDLQREVDAATRDLREAQEQLIRSGQLAAVAQIGAGLAHELNNPLTAVLGITQLLQVQELPEGLQEDLRSLETEAKRCREVVDALLKLTDEEQGSPVGESLLLEIIADVEQSIRPILLQRNVALNLANLEDVRVAIGRGPAAKALTQLLTGLAAGLPQGASLTISSQLDASTLSLELLPSRPVELSNDDWMASGIDVWVARQTLDRLGADLVEPLEEGVPWLVRIRTREG